MKKLVFILSAITVALFTFTACTGTEKPPVPTPQPTGEVTPKPVATAKPTPTPIPENIEGEVILANQYHFKTDHTDKSKSGMYDNNTYWIMHLEADGENRLDTHSNAFKNNNKEGGFSGFVNSIVGILEKDKKFEYIKAKDYYTSDSTGYENLTDKDYIFKTTAHNPVITKVKYVYYKNSSEKPKDYWVQAFRDILNNEYSGHNTPVIVTEIWSFEFNGNKYEIVTANNVVYTGKGYLISKEDRDLNASLPRGNKHLAYRITKVFKTGRDGRTEIINGPYEPYVKVFKEHIGLKYPLESGQCSTGLYYTYKTDEEGNIKLYPFYETAAFDSMEELAYRDVFVFGDFDNDGHGELANQFSYTHIYMLLMVWADDIEALVSERKLHCPLYNTGRYTD